jgi:hypothetical protein
MTPPSHVLRDQVRNPSCRPEVRREAAYELLRTAGESAFSFDDMLPFLPEAKARVSAEESTRKAEMQEIERTFKAKTLDLIQRLLP